MPYIFLAQESLGIPQLEGGIVGAVLVLLGFALRTLYQMVMSDRKETAYAENAAKRRDDLDNKLLSLVERSIISSERSTEAYEKTTTAYEQGVGIIKDNCEAIKSLSTTLTAFKEVLDHNTRTIEELANQGGLFQPLVDRVEILDQTGEKLAEIKIASSDNGKLKLTLIRVKDKVQ